MPGGDESTHCQCGCVCWRGLVPCLIAGVLLRPLFAVDVLADEAAGQAGAPNTDRSDVLEEFDVPKNGDTLIVPVRFADGATYKFIVDTARPSRPNKGS